MKHIRIAFFSIGQGFRNIFRNGVMTVASILVLVSFMIILGTFYLIIDTIDRNFKKIEGLTTVEIINESSYTEEQVNYIGEQLTEICKNSKIVKDEPVFVSSQEHLVLFKEQFAGQSWLDDFDEETNPLRSSYRIEFENFTEIEEVYRLKSQIEGIAVDGVNIPAQNIKDKIEIYENVMNVKNTMFVVCVWIMVVLMIITVFVIMNTIKLGVFARRNEISFMRYCGATKSFIRAPYIVEGVIIGLFSALLAFGIEFYLYEYVLRELVASATTTVNASAIQMEPYTVYMGILALGYVALGLFSGIVSSTVSLKKYLNA